MVDQILLAMVYVGIIAGVVALRVAIADAKTSHVRNAAAGMLRLVEAVAFVAAVLFDPMFVIAVLVLMIVLSSQ
jgi:hypothetical protein